MYFNEKLNADEIKDSPNHEKKSIGKNIEFRKEMNERSFSSANPLSTNATFSQHIASHMVVLLHTAEELGQNRESSDGTYQAARYIVLPSLS